MSDIGIRKIRFSMLNETKLNIDDFDALALALSERCLKKFLEKNSLLRKIYGYFIRTNKPIILIEHEEENTEKMTKILRRYIEGIANKTYSSILFIYDFNEKKC